jgi:hypothetical protein
MVVLGAALVLLALAAPAGAAAADSGPGVLVIGENEETTTFKSAKCRKGKHFFHAEAFSTDGKFELDAFIREFNGFHEYDVALGSMNPAILFQGRPAGSTLYSNQFAPSFPVPGAGLIKFTPDGKRIGIGFGPAMWSEDASSAVVVAGALKCKYPKAKK